MSTIVTDHFAAPEVFAYPALIQPSIILLVPVDKGCNAIMITGLEVNGKEQIILLDPMIISGKEQQWEGIVRRVYVAVINWLELR